MEKDLPERFAAAEAGWPRLVLLEAIDPAQLRSTLGGLIIRNSMTTQTETVDRSEAAESSSRKTTALDWAVFGCLAAGGVGIIKALEMDSPFGVLLCLLGSVAAFGVVFYVHLRKA